MFQGSTYYAVDGGEDDVVQGRERAEEVGEGSFVFDIADVACYQGQGRVDLDGVGVETGDGIIDVGLVARDDGDVGAVFEEDAGATEADSGGGAIRDWLVLGLVGRRGVRQQPTLMCLQLPQSSLRPACSCC